MTHSVDRARPARPVLGEHDPKAYLFCHFTGEAAGAETIRYAVSRGNDALTWRTVNNDRPVLESVCGERGLRDPFVIRSPKAPRSGCWRPI